MQNITFVTQNKHKVSDAQKLLPEFTVNHVDFEVPEIQSMIPECIAEYKIKFAYEHAKEPCFVMDTAMFFDCLNGFPGPYIKDYYHTVGPDRICEIAHYFKKPECQVTTVLAYFDGKKTIFFKETINGSISPQPQGDHGFAWDCIFIPENATKTFGQMSFEEKHSYSVTKKLLRQFHDYVTKQK